VNFSINGVEQTVPKRQTINLAGTGVSVVDNHVENRTDISFSVPAYTREDGSPGVPGDVVTKTPSGSAWVAPSVAKADVTQAISDHNADPNAHADKFAGLQGGGDQIPGLAVVRVTDGAEVTLPRARLVVVRFEPDGFAGPAGGNITASLPDPGDTPYTMTVANYTPQTIDIVDWASNYMPGDSGSLAPISYAAVIANVSSVTLLVDKSGIYQISSSSISSQLRVYSVTPTSVPENVATEFTIRGAGFLGVGNVGSVNGLDATIVDDSELRVVSDPRDYEYASGDKFRLSVSRKNQLPQLQTPYIQVTDPV